MAKARELAVFDFDDTLVKGDTFWRFLVDVAGWGEALIALAQGVAFYRLRAIKSRNDPLLPEFRTYMKAHLIEKLLGGRKMSSLGPAIEKLRAWCVWNESVRASLYKHFSEGHQIVIASGALNIYLPELLKDFPEHVLICTAVKIKNGVLTGEMDSENCVRQGKAQMLAEYLSTVEPFEDSWGYGNAPNDMPMLNMLKHQIII